MKECTIDNDITIPSDNKATRISKPRERSFNLPASFVTSKFAFIIVPFLLFVLSRWTNQLDASIGKTFSQRVAIISFVSDDSLRISSRPNSTFARNCDIIQRFFEQRDLVRGRRVQVVSQRNTFAVDHRHHFVPSPLLIFPTHSPLFCRGKTAVGKCFGPVQLASLVKFREKNPP